MKYLIFLLVLFSTSADVYGSKPIFDLKKGRLFTGIKDIEGRKTLTPVWVCENTRRAKVAVKCEDFGIDELGGPLAEPMGELIIDVVSKRIIHSYGLRHAVLLSDCQDMSKAIRQHLRKISEFCILSSYASHEKFDDREEFGWVFREFRSSKGVVCDFCDSPSIQ